MNIKKVFKLINELNIWKENIEQRKRLLDSQYEQVINSCPHEIVIRYSDNNPRKIAMYGNYYCPACGKKINFIFFDKINETVFNKSKILDFSGFPLIVNKDTLDDIRE